ncbi:hypothetical protein IM774_01575 [Erysipelotrichaceae bacterium RD49]|nr:hypothetical protein [Erysipelotrichaceae bacterium RD49]
MFVQLICKNRSQAQMDELYEVLGALAAREGVQIEDRGHDVEILVCPQGKIVVIEEDKDMILSANTRQGGPGFHAFVVDLFEDIQEEIPGDYEMIDDTEYDKDKDWDRLVQLYENELDYVRKMILEDPQFRNKNYMFDETYYLPKPEKGKVLTATGDMDEEEFKNKNLSDLMDHFYVWNDWDRDARFYRNAALTLLAKEGYGQFAKMNEQTEKIADEICDDLEIAFRMDPTLPLPLKAYNELIHLLGRENKLEGAVEMDREAVQYRTREVYHVFEDAKVVAPGTAERSYDPATQSVFLMAPYGENEEWSWLIQASKQPSILPNLEAVKAVEPIHEDNGNVVWIDEYEVDGIRYLDAIIRDDERYLYEHVLCKSLQEQKYLRTCIMQSGFYAG